MMIRHGKHSSPKTKAVSKKKPPLLLGNVPIQGAIHIFYIIYPTHIIYNVNKALETVFSAISIVIFMIRYTFKIEVQFLGVENRHPSL